MKWTAETANAAFEQLKERAATDKAFLELVLEDAGAAVKELTGHEIPEGIEITFRLDEAGQLVGETAISGERELEESELDAVVGGTSFSAFILYGPPYPEKAKK